MKLPRIQEQLVIDIRRLCIKPFELHENVVPQWLRAHCGMQGNDQADCAVKARMDTLKEMVQIPVPIKRLCEPGIYTRLAFTVILLDRCKPS